MKRNFKNILAKLTNKSGFLFYVYAVYIILISGMLVGCSVAKESTEDESGLLEKEDKLNGSIQIDESLPKFNNNSSEAEQLLDDNSIIIGDVPLSIYENKRDVQLKLEEAGLEYSEFKPDNQEEKYDSCYYIDAWMQIYFLNDVCVRLRAIDVVSEGLNKIVQTARGIRPGGSYSQMVDKYGNSFETHTYAGKGVYTIYRYSISDCICEFGIQGEDSDSIYNIDIYIPSLSPIYDYGEEIQ